jgi:ketosteroid isomerase-like protein
MSQANVDRLREGFEAFNRDGVEAILELIDPDFEAKTPPELSVEPDTYRGHEGVRRYFESFYDVMEYVQLNPTEFIDAGDDVVIPMVVSVKGRDTGIEVDQHVVQVWTMRDGKAVRVRAYAGKAEALKAAGLSE